MANPQQAQEKRRKEDEQRTSKGPAGESADQQTARRWGFQTSAAES